MRNFELTMQQPEVVNAKSFWLETFKTWPNSHDSYIIRPCNITKAEYLDKNRKKGFTLFGCCLSSGDFGGEEIGKAEFLMHAAMFGIVPVLEIVRDRTVGGYAWSTENDNVRVVDMETGEVVA